MTEPFLRYDEPKLLAQLATLSATNRAIFAAICAERLFPLYEQFHERTVLGDPPALGRALNVLWAAIISDNRSGLTEQRDIAESLVPHEDASSTIECALAQHAAAAVSYAIRCLLTGDPHEAEWAARQVYEALDFWVTTTKVTDLNTGRAESDIIRDPLIQAELARQARDITELAHGVRVDNFILHAQKRARAEGKAFFGDGGTSLSPETR